MTLNWVVLQDWSILGVHNGFSQLRQYKQQRSRHNATTINCLTYFPVAFIFLLFGCTLQRCAKSNIGRIICWHLFGLGIFVVFDIIGNLGMEEFLATACHEASPQFHHWHFHGETLFRVWKSFWFTYVAFCITRSEFWILAFWPSHSKELLLNHLPILLTRVDAHLIICLVTKARHPLFRICMFWEIVAITHVFNALFDIRAENCHFMINMY
jgi:hypothetical protein